MIGITSVELFSRENNKTRVRGTQILLETLLSIRTHAAAALRISTCLRSDGLPADIAGTGSYSPAYIAVVGNQFAVHGSRHTAPTNCSKC